MKKGLCFVYVLVILLGIHEGYAQNVLQYESNDVFVVPAGAIAEVTVQAWGAGGGGGTGNGPNTLGDEQGGGGGGAYASSTLTLEPGTYFIKIGAGGRPGENGGNTIFSGSSYNTAIFVEAEGGMSGNSDSGFSGGSASNSSGDITYSGGTGGDAPKCGLFDNIINPGGGGGGSAYANAIGGNGDDGLCDSRTQNGVGGSGGNGEGNGGKGGTNGNRTQNASTRSGDDGAFPGGGGGGKGSGSKAVSGNGAGGLLILSYEFILPITLAFFDVEKVNGTVQLNWVTASETNNDYFQIEYSHNGSEFEVIGEVQGQGNSNQEHHYQFTHRKIKSGVQYYRLKQIDFDNRFSYSHVVSVTEGNTDSSITVYPNPVVNQLEIHLMDQSNAVVTLFDANGRQLNLVKHMTGNGVVLDVSYLHEGVYFVKIEDNHLEFTKRVIKR